AGEFELPVEPGVQDWSAIDLYCQLRPSNVVKIGVGLDHKARGVGMRTDDFESTSKVLRHKPRHHCPTAHHDMPTRCGRPLLRFIHAVKASFFQTGSYVFSRVRSEEHTSELQSRFDLVCRLLLEKKNYTRR